MRLPARCPVELISGQAVTDGWVYVSRHGHLLNAAGQPRRLTDQATLITALLAELPALRELAGPDPEQWIERTRARPTGSEPFRPPDPARRWPGSGAEDPGSGPETAHGRSDNLSTGFSLKAASGEITWQDS